MVQLPVRWWMTNLPSFFQTCTYCGQEFSKGQKLRYHMRLHTGEGLLTCDLCQKVFTNSYSLKTHLKRVHAKIQVTTLLF